MPVEKEIVCPSTVWRRSRSSPAALAGTLSPAFWFLSSLTCARRFCHSHILINFSVFLIGSTSVLVYRLALLSQTHHCVSYPDHLDLNSILEKSPDLGCYFLPGLPHRSQPLQLFKCGICLETVQNLCTAKHVLVDTMDYYTQFRTVIWIISKTHLTHKWDNIVKDSEI